MSELLNIIVAKKPKKKVTTVKVCVMTSAESLKPSKKKRIKNTKGRRKRAKEKEQRKRVTIERAT